MMSRGGIFGNWLMRLGLLGALAVLQGCAAFSLGSPEPGWAQARFRFSWPEGQEPAFYKDALIAHRVVAPVLERNRDAIRLWRFHRRAARDKSGHQFSLLIYGSPRTVGAVFGMLRNDPTLQLLEEAGDIKEVRYENLSENDRPGIGDSSDTHWPDSIQDTWPWFIMGASRAWLALVDEAVKAENPPNQRADVQALRRMYRRADKRVRRQWREQAAHAYFHHLNALFGYESFQVNEKWLMRF